MNKSLIRFFEVYVFVFAFLAASRPVGDADLWFHLKTGEYIFSTGLIPRTEMWSFTHPGIPWTAHGWLSGVLFYAVYSSVGVKVLIFMFALLAAIAFWIVFKRSNSHPFIAGAATLITVWAVLPHIAVRPRVFTILFTSIYLALLGRFAGGVKERWIWILIPLTVIWANLHGGFIIGLMLIGITAVGMVLDYWTGVLEEPETLRSRMRALAIIFVGCVLAGLLNPYGIKLYTAPITVLRSPLWQDLVVDWLSPNFHVYTTRPLMLLMLATIAVFGLSPKRPKPSEMFLFLVTLYSTLKIQRNAVVFVLVAAPMLAEYFQIWVDSTRFGKYFGPVRQRVFVLLSLALLLALMPLAIQGKSSLYYVPSQESLGVPVKAVEYLKQNNIKGNTFTSPNVWGAYVLWAAPDNPVYIDGRDVYPDTFVREFVDMQAGRVDWRAPFNQRGVEIAVLRPTSLLARQLGESAEWERIYNDEVGVVYRRRPIQK